MTEADWAWGHLKISSQLIGHFKGRAFLPRIYFQIARSRSFAGSREIQILFRSTVMQHVALQVATRSANKLTSTSRLLQIFKSHQLIPPETKLRDHDRRDTAQRDPNENEPNVSFPQRGLGGERLRERPAELPSLSLPLPTKACCRRAAQIYSVARPMWWERTRRSMAAPISR